MGSAKRSKPVYGRDWRYRRRGIPACSRPLRPPLNTARQRGLRSAKGRRGCTRVTHPLVMMSAEGIKGSTHFSGNGRISPFCLGRCYGQLCAANHFGRPKPPIRGYTGAHVVRKRLSAAEGWNVLMVKPALNSCTWLPPRSRSASPHRRWRSPTSCGGTRCRANSGGNWNGSPRISTPRSPNTASLRATRGITPKPSPLRSLRFGRAASPPSSRSTKSRPRP